MTKKKWGKKASVIGCILLALGVLLSGIGFVGMGFSLDVFSTPSYPASEPESYTFTGDPVTAVNIEVATCPLQVEGVAGLKSPELTISPDLFTYQIENGTLTVREKEGSHGGWKWYRLFNINASDYTRTTLRLPEDFSGSMKLKAAFGSVKVINLSKLQDLQVESESGTVRLDNVTVQGAVNVRSSFGDLKLQQCEMQSLTLKNESGGTTLDHCQAGKAEITTKFGDLRITDSRMESLSQSNDSGGVRLESVEITKSFESRSNFGDLRFEKLSCPNLKLNAESGSIRGTIDGSKRDYRIATDIKYGNTNLNGQLDGKYTLEVGSTYGDVKIEFIED